MQMLTYIKKYNYELRGKFNMMFSEFARENQV